MSDAASPLANFTGRARLFPLPNLVLFPHAMQPLHIFEPRYREMTADALADDRLITMALPRPGWEADYNGAPAIYPVATIGVVVADQKLEDGRYNILLKGLSRILVVEEPPREKLYRQARVEVLEETPLTGKQREQKWRRILTKKIPEWFPGQDAVVQQFRKLLHSGLPLGPLCDILAFALPLEVAVKQNLLEELEVEERLKRLVGVVDAPDAPEITFPPEFSVN